ncbi:hypothetical protein D1816_18630 [Aquimarina sp. AD10]|uniref:hypothetical protein n=1 Tax=Aquimarina sp. AD10 TaxID=1714849 RepID=UPI000E539856|nr:hypothetical protein [Aquimarina sp. AD10]AXT62292.1 hypothetical protein D1816_18630 [Aquimarina sp. AD10]RKM90513.1 hypothetical protein D7033_23750 [Aquimarina sp. AD10]
MNIIVIVVLLIIGLIIVLLFIGWILKLWQERLGWNAYGSGRDGITYTQKVDGKWKRIEIDAELLLGKINRIIYFKTEKEWTAYPEWAQNRTEIIHRIKLKYPANRTEYENA